MFVDQIQEINKSELKLRNLLPARTAIRIDGRLLGFSELHQCGTSAAALAAGRSTNSYLIRVTPRMRRISNSSDRTRRRLRPSLQLFSLLATQLKQLSIIRHLIQTLLAYCMHHGDPLVRHSNAERRSQQTGMPETVTEGPNENSGK